MFVLGASLIAAAGVGNLLRGSIEEAREAQKVGAATEQIIKATGGAANLSAKQIGNMSSALSTKIGVDDEVIQAGANLLLTFKGVRNEAGKGSDVFTRATKAGADLAATGFGSIESNAKTLGKALNDPTKGITALTRAGVTFTEGQKKQIAGFVESGDLLSAQKVILGEVEKQVGGVAKATATSGEKASVAYGNIKETLGTAFLPAIDSVQNAFVKSAPKIEGAIKGIGPAFGRVQAFLAPFITQVKEFFQGPGGEAISKFATQVGATFRADVLPVLQQAAQTFQTVVLPAITSLVQYVATSLFPIFKQVAAIITGQVIPIFSSLAGFLYGTVYPAVFQIVTVVAKNLKPVFDQLVATLSGTVLPAVSKMLTKFDEAKPTFEKAALVVLKVVGTLAKFVSAVLGKVLPVVIRLVGFVLSKLIPAIASIAIFLAKAIIKIVDFGKKIVAAVQFAIEFQKGVVKAVGKVLEYIGKVPGKIKGFFKSAGTLLKDIGGQIIDGLVSGIKAAARKVADAVNAIIEIGRAHV